MRSLLLLAFIANVLLSLSSLWLLPSQAAIHFGSGGIPNGWASREAYTLIMLFFDALLFVSFFFAPLSFGRVSTRWINLPNKDYWLTEERKEEALGRLSNFLAEFGALMLLFFFFVGVLVLAANRSDPVRLNEGFFYPFFIGFMVYTAHWVARIYRAFRRPN